MGSSKKSDDSVDEKIEKVIIKRQITLLQGVAIIVGIIIGSGIFVSPVGILKETKSVGFSLVMWVVCGIYNTLCAICYAELGTTIPESGGEYVYIKRAFGEIPAFICLWINFLLICPVGIAASALIFSLYILKPMFPDCEIPEEALALLAACIFCLLIAVNCRNVKWAAKVQVVITLSKLIALAIIIVIGMYYIIGKGETENFENAFEGSDYSAGAIAISFYSGFWAYSGWSYLNFLVGELVDPNRNLPRAILISMTLVIVTYLIANVAYLGVLSPAEMLLSPAVAVTFGERTMGVMAWLMPVLIAVSVTGTMNGTALSMSSFGEYSMGIMAWLMPVLIAISVCGTMNGCALSMSRLFFVGAQNKQFPTFMSMIDVKRMTPSPSLFVILFLTMLYVSSKDIFFLIEMEGFGFASVLTMVFAGQIYLRYREPNIPRPIRVHIILPIILFLISFGIIVLTFYQKPKESFMALGLVAAGIFLYLIGTWKHKPKEIAGKLHSINIFIQKLLLVMPPDNSDDIDWE